MDRNQDIRDFSQVFISFSAQFQSSVHVVKNEQLDNFGEMGYVHVTSPQFEFYRVLVWSIIQQPVNFRSFMILFKTHTKQSLTETKQKNLFKPAEVSNFPQNLGSLAPISFFNCEHFLFIYNVKQKKKCRPDWFSRFDVYWIKTNKQVDRQTSKVYIKIKKLS